MRFLLVEVQYFDFVVLNFSYDFLSIFIKSIIGKAKYD